MRNLKKILALVLALVMSLSLMATAGAGSFQDVTDDNPYKTAIDVLDALKVFQGFEDGTFKPTDTLNRAQAAVLVYRIATGDVDNKFVANYTDMAQSKFTDLDGYNWARGYINYCQNAKIVVGTSATTFNPEAPVTGYQLMVMLLRTLGYGAAGEFADPTKWELETAKIAEREGILKNVTGGDFGAPAQRQMVAEILFRGLLHETVEYSPLTPNGYTNSGVTLGSRVGLEEITGVVVANEIADLGDTDPLAEGRTNLVVGEKTYKLNLSTTAEEIGTAIHAYIKGNDVLAREDAGTDIKDNDGAKTKVNDLRDGLRLTDDTEYYVNYDPVLKDTSDWRLEYVVVLEKWTEKEIAQLVYDNGGVAFIDDNSENLQLDDAEKGSCIYKTHSTNANSATYLKDNGDGVTKKTYTYDKVIPVEEIITTKDHEYIKKIFYGSDSFNSEAEQGDDTMTGEVYVATRSGKNSTTDKSYDISDELNYKEFYEKYIDDDKNRSFDGCDRGEWLRVIDNDGDGEAEYVLRVDFVMTTVTDYDKRTDTYTVEYDVDGNGAAGKAPNSIETTIKAGDIAMMSEDTDLSVGAVVLYAYIDGVYHVCNPQVATAAIEKKTIDIKTETFTADGTDYTWSGIDEEAAEYYDELVELDEEVTYDLYLDHFGFVRLATEASKGLVLLTDGYYNTNYRDSEWKATIWNGTELADVDVKDCDTDRKVPTGFIDETESVTNTGTDHGNRGTWLRLREFGQFYYDGERNNDGTYNHDHYVDPDVATVDVDDLTDPAPAANSTYADPFLTNIAAYVEEDGVYSLYDVTDISTVNGLKRELNAYEVVGTELGYKTATVDNETVKAKNRTLYGIAHNDASNGIYGWNGNSVVDANLKQVQTTGDTVYYFVGQDSKGNIEVTSWTGYENVPEELGNFTAKRAYMVSHSINTASYEIADVVVFEGAKEIKSKDAWLIVSAINTKRERSLGKDDEGNYGETSTSLEVFSYDGQTLDVYPGSDAAVVGGLQQGQVVFFSAKDTPIESNFAEYGIYAGTVVVAPGTRNNNYCEFEIETNQRYHYGFYTDEVNAYELNQDTDEGAHASRNLAVRDAGRIELNDKLIVMCDKDMNVLMAVNVDRSGKDGERDGSITKLNALWSAIDTDQDDNKYWDVTATITGNNPGDAVDLANCKVSKSTGRLTLAVDDSNYSITNVTVTTGEAEAAVVNGDWTLINVKSDVAIAVTVAHATYGVTLDTTGITNTAIASIIESANSTDIKGSLSATATQIDAGTTLTMTITPDPGYDYTVKVNETAIDPDEVDGHVYTITVNEDKDIEVTEVTAPPKSTTTKPTAVKVNGDALSDDAYTDGTKTYAVADLPHGESTADVEFTLPEGAKILSVWEGQVNFGTPVELAGTNGVGPYTLDVGSSYSIVIQAEDTSVKYTYVLNLAAASASDACEIDVTEAANYSITVTGTKGSTGTITLPNGTSTTWERLKDLLTIPDTATWGDVKTSDGSAINDMTNTVAADATIEVVAQDTTTKTTYTIKFAP